MSQLTSRAHRSARLQKELTHWQLYLLALPAVIYILVFCYKPMYGVITEPGMKSYIRFAMMPS